MKFISSLVTGLLLSAPAFAASNPALLPVVPNVATMQALGLAAVQYPNVHVNGYFAANDGGGGDFAYFSSCPSATDLGVNLSVTGVAGACYQRQLNGTTVISGLYYGMKGDSSSAGAGTDNTARLQQAIDYAITNQLALYIPASKTAGDCYSVSSSILFDGSVAVSPRGWKGIRVFGDNAGTAGINSPSKGSSVLCSTVSANNTPAFDFSSTSYGKISDISFVADSSQVVVLQARTTNAFSALEAQNVVWQNVNFGQAACAGYFNYSHEADDFYSVNFHQGNGGYGALFTKKAAQCANFTVPNAVASPSMTQINIYGGSAVGSTVGLIAFDPNGSVISGINIDGMYLAPSGASARGIVIADGTVEHIHITIPRMEVTSSSGTADIVYIDNTALVEDADFSLFGETDGGGINAVHLIAGGEIRGWSVTTPQTLLLSGTYTGGAFWVNSSDATNSARNNKFFTGVGRSGNTTFVPTLTSTGGGTITYTGNGTYNWEGRNIWVNEVFTSTATSGTLTGDLQFSLPVQAENSSFFGTTCSVTAARVSLDASYTWLGAQVPPGATVGTFYESGSGQDIKAITGAKLAAAANSSLVVFCYYTTATSAPLN